jgi:hypothetical protein
MNKLNDIWNSFKTNAYGLSGRKISAATAVLVGAYVTKYKIPTEMQFWALVVWLCYSAVCLGLVTIPELIKFVTELKNGSKKDELTQ